MEKTQQRLKFQSISFENHTIDELKSIYDEVVRAYYESDEPMMTDEKYDELESYLWQNGIDTGSAINLNVDYKSKIERPYKMYSLNKFQMFNAEMSDEDAQTLFNKYGAGDLSWKYDGLAIELHYKNGKLKSVSTRGNGEIGRDVTEKLKVLVPNQITTNQKDIYIRCEGVMSTKTFNEKYSEYSNPRNLTSGIVADINMNDERIHDISIIAHEYLDSNGIPHQITDKFGIGTKVSFKINSWQELQQKYGELNKLRADFDYPTDGLVYVSDSHIGKIVDANGKYPRTSTSIKFQPPRLFTKITEITWELKRGGQYQPIIHFEPVYYDGRFIRKASGYNYKYVVLHDLVKGTEVEIIISNDIIPIVKPITK